MQRYQPLYRLIGSILLLFSSLAVGGSPVPGYSADSSPQSGRLAYLVSDLRIPFWSIMSRGIAAAAAENGYVVTTYSADNQAKQELANTVKAIASGVDGIILSPTNSSASVTLLKLAAKADIPVVIADIGTDAGRYVSFISSDNRSGAYGLGKLLVRELKRRDWEDGSVGIIAIPQKRANGQARTAGFMQALKEAGIDSAAIEQQVDFSYRETYEYSLSLIRNHPRIRALWLQGSDRYQAALDAIADSGREEQILLVCFDAEPEFIRLIANGVIVGAAMQQPFRMGEIAVEAMHRHLTGSGVEKNISLPVLAISRDNIEDNLTLIRRNVLGLVDE